MKIADLYLRVGTGLVVDRANSLQEQEEVLRQYCNNHNIKVRKVIFDVCSASTFNRPEWNKAFMKWRKNKGLVDLLLFTTWDRFSRNASDALQMITALRSFGIEPQAIQQSQNSISEMLEKPLAIQDVQNSFLEIQENRWPRYILN